MLKCLHDENNKNAVPGSPTPVENMELSVQEITHINEGPMRAVMALKGIFWFSKVSLFQAQA